MKLIIAILVNIIVCANMYAQEVFSDLEKTEFVNLYFESKLSTAGNFDSLVKEYSVSHDRLKEIFLKSLLGEKIKLTVKERMCFDQFSRRKLEAINQKISNIKKATENYDITWSRYIEILNLYQSDIVFQRSLKPYFQQYIISKS